MTTDQGVNDMTMRITMLQTRMGESGSLLTAGSTYTVSDKFGAEMVGAKGYATDTDGVLSSPKATGLQDMKYNPLTGSAVDADANRLFAIYPAGSPSDLLSAPLQHVTITGAISTTATQAATATGTYYKARVVWNNNGASGSAKLRIAVNCDNDVHGLMVGQSAKRRDHEMTMGDGVILVCGVPITNLSFSADSSITGGTHQLQVTFGN